MRGLRTMSNDNLPNHKWLSMTFWLAGNKYHITGHQQTCTVRVVTGLCTRLSAGVSVDTDPVCITVVPATDTTAPICWGGAAWLSPTTTAWGVELGTGTCVEGTDGAGTWGTDGVDPEFPVAATCCCCKGGAMNACPADSTWAWKVKKLYLPKHTVRPLLQLYSCKMTHIQKWIKRNVWAGHETKICEKKPYCNYGQ